jgi:hypothetical protein
MATDNRGSPGGHTVGNAQSFVEDWSRVWRGPDSDPQFYMELLHEDCRLVNPFGAGTRQDLPQIFESVLAVEPDIRVVPTRWAETEDGVIIEWVNTGTVRGHAIEIRGVDRFTLRDGKGSEGYSYFDPRPLLDDEPARG